MSKEKAWRRAPFQWKCSLGGVFGFAAREEESMVSCSIMVGEERDVELGVVKVSAGCGASTSSCGEVWARAMTEVGGIAAIASNGARTDRRERGRGESSLVKGRWLG